MLDANWSSATTPFFIVVLSLWALSLIASMCSITFFARKLGLFTFPMLLYCGIIVPLLLPLAAYMGLYEDLSFLESGNDITVSILLGALASIGLLWCARRASVLSGTQASPFIWIGVFGTGLMFLCLWLVKHSP